MNIPVIRTNSIVANNKKLEIDGNVLVKGSIRANSIVVNDKPLEESILDASQIAAEANKSYTWIKWSQYYNGYDLDGNPSMTDSPVVNSVYMGVAYNKGTSAESDNPSDYDWAKLQGNDAIQYYTWIKFATGPNGEGMSDDPIDDTYQYMGVAYNQTDTNEQNNPALYTWSKFVGPQGVTGPNGWTWIKYATGPNGEGISESPVGMDYMGIAYNKGTSAESIDPYDYVWSLFRGPQGLTGPIGHTGAAGVGGLSLIVSGTNFSFTADFDGSITEASYSNATASVIILDTTSALSYSSLNFYINPIYTYILDNGEYVLSSSNVILTESEVFGLLNNGEWVVQSVKCTDISISDFNTVVEPDQTREYITTIHPTGMNPATDTASIAYKIIGKTLAGSNFNLFFSLFFTKATTGPGVMYRGEYKSTTNYFNTAQRRDVVFFPVPGVSNYWLTSNQLKSGLNTWDTPGVSTDWKQFGAEFSSIATGVIISEESYVKNTLNIGTNSNTSDANMTLYGGSDFPFMSIGQSGSSMEWGATGVWMGVYNKDTDGDGIGDTKGHAFSIGDQTNSLRWDGDELIVIGGIKQYDTTSDYGQNTPSGWVASTKYVDDNIAYTVQIISSQGSIFKNNQISTVLNAVVKKGNDDVTNLINEINFNWERTSSNAASDSVWNNDTAHKGKRSITVTDYDVSNKATFDCIVTLPAI